MNLVKDKYFKLVYHCQYKDNEPCRTNNYFLTKDLLYPKLNLWNSKTREWKYWESTEDSLINLSAIPVNLPTLTIGWYGATENEGVFNYSDSNGDYYGKRILAPGII